MKFRISVETNEFIKLNWSTFETVIKDSFKNAIFNNEYSLNGIIDELRSNINSPCKYLHVVIYDDDNNLSGGLLSISPKSKSSDRGCEVGWFFTSPKYSSRIRLKISDMVLNRVDKLVRDLGYDFIETDMGTVQGQKLLSRKYDYVFCPEKQEKKWVKML